MTEWGVVLVISSLLGLLTIAMKPMISLTKAITKLTSTVEVVENRMDEISTKNHDSHQRLWDHNDEQDTKIVEHDKRITRLEDKR